MDQISNDTPMYIIETRHWLDRKLSPWSRVCEELLSKADLAEFQEGPDEGPDVEYRARRHPQFGFEEVALKFQG